MGIDIPVIWFVIIVFATLMYIVMDGFDLGIGIVFSFVPNANERDVMMNSVARCGTAMRHGLCWAARGYSAPFRWRTPSSPMR